MKRKTFYILLFTLGIALFLIVLMVQLDAPSNMSNLHNELWSLNLNQSIMSTPLLNQDNIIVRTDQELYSLNKTTGQVEWKANSVAYAPVIDSYAVSRPITSSQGFLAVAEESNRVRVYSTKTGDVYWEIPPQSSFIYELNLIDNILIVARHDSSLQAYEVSSGRSLWEVKVPPRSYLAIAANSTNVVLSAKNQIQVFELQTGKLLKEKIYGVSTGKVVLKDSTIFLCYIENKNWHVASIQLNTLDTNWIFNAGKIAECYLSIANDQLFIYSDILISLDEKSGNLLWQDDIQDFYSAPAVYNDSVYYVSITEPFRENICVSNSKTGESKKCIIIHNTNWLFGLPSQIPSPIVVNNTLIIPVGSEIRAYLLGHLTTDVP